MTSASRETRVIAGRYRIVRPLGAGAHGVVELAEDLLNGGRHVAIKRLEGLLGAGDPEPAAERLRWFQHPHWAEILDEGRLPEHGRYQVMRFVPGASLEGRATGLPPDEVWRLLEDGARVLRAFHLRGLIHYDVTPGNVLREDRPEGVVFTLTDGGLASLGPVRGIARGAPAFMAPEVLDGAPHDHRVDLYSLGLVAFRMAAGRDPLTGGAGEVLGRRRREAAPLARSVNPSVPEALEKVLAWLLERDPAQRPQDADALLARLATLGRRRRPQITEDEAAALAAGGRLVGREALLARFRRACRALADTPEAGASFLPATPGSPAPKPPARDAVLVVQGPQGSGGTRLLREFQAIARTEGTAVLSLSGRDSAAERRSVIRRLADGVSRLAGDLDPDDGTTRSDARSDRGDADASGGEAAAARAIERFIDLCERTSRKSPVVLLVEDFAELAPPTQEALRVLSRHLISRVEHPDGRPAPSVLLVVEHGADDPAGFLIPDASQARRPIVELSPLTGADVRALLADRFPTLEPVDPDIETVRAQSEGSPGAIVGYLAQGYVRGDLRADTDRFSWDLSRFDTYRYERALSAEARRALDASSPAVRSTLEQLALLEAPVPEALAAALCSTTDVGLLPESRLISVSREGVQVRLALAGRAVRDAVLEGLGDDRRDELRKGLLRALARTPVPELAAEEARLLLDASDPAQALHVLAQSKAALPSAARARAQAVATRIATQHPDLLATPSHRATLAATLLPGPDAKVLAAALIAHFPAAIVLEDLRAACLVADHLFLTRQLPAADAFAARAESLQGVPPDLEARVVELRVLRARAKLAMNQLAPAKALLTQCASSLRHLGRSVRARELRLMAAYWLARGRALLHEESYSRGISLNRRAARAARHARDTTNLSQALNNLGICMQRAGQGRDAERTMTRGIRLRLAAGDIQGASGLLQNLARVVQLRGALLESAALHSRAAALGSRFARHDAVLLALFSLKEIYDRQGNSGLAGRTLVRANAIAELHAPPRIRALVAHSLAELCAAQGAQDQAESHLLDAARSIRLITGDRPLAAYNISHALVAFHGPDRRRASTWVRRSAPRPSDPETAGAVHALRVALRLDGERPCQPSLLRGKRDYTQAAPKLLRALLALTVAFARSKGRVGSQLLIEAIESRYLPDSEALTGIQQRAWFETVLAASVMRGIEDPEVGRILAVLAKVAAQRGLHAVEARALALRATSLLAQGDAATASSCLTSITHTFTQSAQSAKGQESATGRSKEILFCLATLRARRDGGSPPSGASIPYQLHAETHCLQVEAGSAASPDTRRQTAMRSILAVSAKLKTGAGLEALLESLNDFAREITKAARTCIVLLSPNSQREIRIASSSSGSDSRARLETISKTVIRRVLSSRTPLLLHDVFGDTELMARPSIVSLSLRSVLCVPMLRGSDLYGVMYADNTSGAGSFDAVDLEILCLFAEQAAAAIETSRLLADIQRSYSELKAAQERLLRGERLRVMGEMTSGVAHEFNNLLTAILARVQLMHLGYLPAEVQEHLRLIEQAALDAAGVVRRLQGFTRFQRQAHFQLVDASEICADVIELLRPLWASQRRNNKPGISVRLRAAKGLFVRADPTELREVITNLLKNSLDAVERGGTVAISVEPRAGRVRITVSDDGTGIPKDLLPKIFDPFFTTKGERGTGLGLCLSQQIVERHGGELKLTSEPNSGTTAIVELAEAATEQESAAELVKPTSDSTRKVRVMVVDDDPNVLDPLCRYLQRSGYEVCAVGSAQKAIEETVDARPDLLISDIAMPGMDGIELCRTLKGSFPSLPVVLMSGQASAIDPSRVREAGAAALLAKPFTMRQVMDLVSSLSKSGN